MSMNDTTSPVIGYQAMSEYIFGTTSKWRVVRTMCDARQLPFMMFGRQRGMWPETYEKFRREQEESNSANGRKRRDDEARA